MSVEDAFAARARERIDAAIERLVVAGTSLPPDRQPVAKAIWEARNHLKEVSLAAIEAAAVRLAAARSTLPPGADNEAALAAMRDADIYLGDARDLLASSVSTSVNAPAPGDSETRQDAKNELLSTDDPKILKAWRIKEKRTWRVSHVVGLTGQVPTVDIRDSELPPESLRTLKALIGEQ